MGSAKNWRTHKSRENRYGKLRPGVSPGGASRTQKQRTLKRSSQPLWDMIRNESVLNQHLKIKKYKEKLHQTTDLRLSDAAFPLFSLVNHRGFEPRTP